MSNQDKPMLANMVAAGGEQTAATTLTPSIHMVTDISNAYLVNTDDGDVFINTGFMGRGAQTRALFEPHRSGPVRAIILTQAHPDHYGGVPEMRDEGSEIITGAAFEDTCAYFSMLDTFIRARSGRIWKGTVKGRDQIPPTVIPDTRVATPTRFTFGGKTFEVIPTPGGESPCATVVWLPEERTVFTGNLFGPVFLSVPNLCTIRGDKPRSAKRWLANLDTVRALGAELLITGHGDPIRGADQIRTALDRMHAAVSWIHDQTVAGMNAGKDVHTLMREITLPAELSLGEYHGKVAWAVRTIWEEYSGWFHMDSTTSLYGVPRTAINEDLVALAGADALAARAAAKCEQNQPLQALHLTDIVLAVEPDHSAALEAARSALNMLLAQSGAQNMSETMWLRGQIGSIDARLGC